VGLVAVASGRGRGVEVPSGRTVGYVRGDLEGDVTTGFGVVTGGMVGTGIGEVLRIGG
jgi:hypothetical protein